MRAAICAGGLEPKIARALSLLTLADEVMEIPGVERFVGLHEFLGISGAFLGEARSVQKRVGPSWMQGRRRSQTLG